MTTKRNAERPARVPETLRARGAACRTDGQLLEQFLAEQNDDAFAHLVTRHGPMVRSVCARILGNTADAEDAFQAAFLTLLRRADDLRSRPVVGDWLHGVARRTALNAKRLAERRREKEKTLARPAAQPQQQHDEGLALLDDVLGRLPEKYRLPIVLCDLEGEHARKSPNALAGPRAQSRGAWRAAARCWPGT